MFVLLIKRSGRMIATIEYYYSSSVNPAHTVFTSAMSSQPFNLGNSSSCRSIISLSGAIYFIQQTF